MCAATFREQGRLGQAPHYSLFILAYAHRFVALCSREGQLEVNLGHQTFKPYVAQNTVYLMERVPPEFLAFERS